MSLATRCTACGTVFRVVQDQLKVSEGWVRCGRCSEVFSALEGLFDLDRHALTAAAPDPAPGVATTTAEVGEAAQREPSTSAEPTAPNEPTDMPAVNAPPNAPSATTEPPGEGLRDDFESSRGTIPESTNRSNDQSSLDALALAEGVSPELVEGLTAHALRTESGAQPPEAAEVGFAGYSGYRKRRRSGSARILLTLGTVVFAFGLGIQAVYHYRDLLTARFPVIQQPMESFCRLVGCRIDAAMRVEDLYVESTSLTRHALPDAFLLSLSLRSRADFVLALPAVELSLTGVDGELVARKILMAGDFKSPVRQVGPRGEVPLSAVITGGGKVTGYTVEIFYP